MTEKRETRVEEIIEAAVLEFVEKGYADASMESIAKRAKLSKGGLYHHFKSKAEILYTVNVKCMQPIMELMLKIESRKSLVTGLKQFVIDYINYWNDHRRELSLYFLTMNESFGNSEIMEMYKESTRQYFGYFENLFRKGQESGIFTTCDTHSHALAFISCLNGFLGYMLIDQSIPVNSIVKEIQETFINALKR